METKFTKGKWKIDTSEDYTVSVVSPWSTEVTSDNFSTFADYRGALICEMHYNTGVPTKETAIANAKLIAAAPALLQEHWINHNHCATVYNMIANGEIQPALRLLDMMAENSEYVIKKATE